MKRSLLASVVMVTAIALAVVLGLTRSAHRGATGPGMAPTPLQLGVAEFLRRPLFDEQVFLNGFLVPGSLCRVSDPCELRFRVTDRAAVPGSAAPRGHTLAVSFPSCLIPRPMRSNSGGEVEVIVGGQVCATCHDFQASDVLARAAQGVAPPGPLSAVPDSVEDIPLCSAP